MSYSRVRFRVEWRKRNRKEKIMKEVQVLGMVLAVLVAGMSAAEETSAVLAGEGEYRLYHGSVQFVDHDADLALVGVDDPAFMAGITPMEIGETPHVQDDELAVNRGGIARCPQVRRNSRFA